jgi:two-component system, NtrC family, response regulator AtoC
MKLVAAVAPLPDPVLLLGETGVGKTFLARVIHSLGPRSRSPFIGVNVSGVPESLFEREFFGHARGAFTGAMQPAPGLLEAAHGGTLLLDEIGDLSLNLQTKLLSVVEDKRSRRIGSTREQSVDVRILAATNADLDVLLRERRIREDLFFRLSIFTIQVPPLRDRLDQLPRIARCLLHRIRPTGEPLVLDRSAIETLMRYTWPGNIRELDGVLRHAAAFGQNGTIRQCDLPERIRHAANGHTALHTGTSSPSNRLRYSRPADPDQEREMIRKALAEERGNRVRASRRLGMSRSTLYFKMARFSLDSSPEPT